MKSKKNGKSTSNNILIQSISNFGIWIFIKDKEYFLSFKHFPWFKNAKIADIQNVKLQNGHHLRWSTLDIDLDLDSITNPEKYPMVFI